MWNIILVATKKVITQKWIIEKLPPLEEWIDLVKEIAQMEKLTFALRC